MLSMRKFRKKFITKKSRKQRINPKRKDVKEDDISTTAKIKKRYLIF